MSLKIIDEGMLTTVQDLGRKGYMQYGVVHSGVMDEIAARLANSLLGNDENDAVLEMTLLGPTILFESNYLIAICGADLSAKINGEFVPLWRPIYVKKGSILHFARPREGCRAYLAVAGGIDVPVVMNSRSTYVRGAIGGYKGRELHKGDVLDQREITNSRTLSIMEYLGSRIGLKTWQTVDWSISSKLIPNYKKDPKIRFIKGPQYHLFTKKSREQFNNEAYIVTPDSDRMGYRLSSSRLALSKPLELLSEAVTMGTIQVPSDGKPIILMLDRQTIGGYPKIGYVASVDLPLLAQVIPGGKLSFEEVTTKEAQNLLIDREQQLSVVKVGISLMYRGLKNA